MSDGKKPWIVITDWCSTQRNRFDFTDEYDARSFAAKRRSETRDRVYIIEPDGYICELKDGTP